MSDYIKRDDAENIMLGSCDESALWKLRRLPPADVVEVVRCKDCKYNPKSLGWVTCPMTGANTRKDDDYCSYGEREDGEEE